MPSVPPLASLRIRGFTSIADTTIDLDSDVTLLVGPNGSGKSNVVNAFELLGRIVDGQLNEHVLRRGGLASMLHAASDPAESANQIVLDAWGEEHAHLANGYQAVVSRGSADSVLVHETTLFHDRGRYDAPMEDRLQLATESQLKDVAQGSARARYALEVISGCRVFHFDDTSADAPVKTLGPVADDLTLAPDAHNLAAVLLRIQENDRETYSRIVRAIRTVAPYFDDFVLKPEHDSIRLRWRERRLDRVFSADALSDGTTRFVCLAVLLLQPDPPSTIVLDEPELGLHPFAIHQLAGLMHLSARDHRIIAATQSVTLLSEFDVTEVAVVERSARGSIVARPEPDALAQWLEEYSLGEMWEKNLLGGQPRPDESPRLHAS